MLIASLILCSIVLAVANLAAACRAWPKTAIAVSSLAAIMLGCLGGAIFPPVMLQLFGLLVVCVMWQWSGRNAWWFFASSIVVTFVAFGVASMLSQSTLNEYGRLREKFPFESMKSRLPLPKAELHTAALPRPAAVRFKELENNLDDVRYYYAFLLKELHEDSVELFVNSPGFGVGRVFGPTEGRLKENLRAAPSPLQPGQRLDLAWSPADQPPVLRPNDEASFHSLNQHGIENFVYPKGWGYFRDRAHVAGFQPHQFSEVPPSNTWKIKTLDLVSLLLHDDPAVYVSDRLPQMDKVHDVPTRPLDTFESFGLESLKNGEELFLGGSAGELRMLGAVRSVKQCLGCHGGERGDLLGAFSYSLKRSELE